MFIQCMGHKVQFSSVTYFNQLSIEGGGQCYMYNTLSHRTSGKLNVRCINQSINKKGNQCAVTLSTLSFMASLSVVMFFPSFVFYFVYQRTVSSVQLKYETQVTEDI